MQSSQLYSLPQLVTLVHYILTTLNYIVLGSILKYFRNVFIFNII